MTREEAVLMPRYSRRTSVDPTRTRLDAERRRDALDVAILDGQLRALERDIRSARAAASAPIRGSAARATREAPALRPEPRGERVRLASGADILIRPIEPEDAPQLKDGFERLSALSRYKRFLGPVDHLTGHQLEYLTAVDHVDHEALVALNANSGAGVGVARYVRDARDPRLAEVAVVVTDSWQGRGVASALLERLSERARLAGIELVVGRSILNDRAARALAAHAGAHPVARRRLGTTELTVRLSRRENSRPSRSPSSRSTLSWDAPASSRRLHTRSWPRRFPGSRSPLERVKHAQVRRPSA